MSAVTDEVDDTTDVLHDLLVAAAAAHGVHEAQDLNGVYDTEWPWWYAAHMAAALAEGGYRIVKE